VLAGAAMRCHTPRHRLHKCKPKTSLLGSPLFVRNNGIITNKDFQRGSTHSSVRWLCLLDLTHTQVNPSKHCLLFAPLCHKPSPLSHAPTLPKKRMPFL
jgi:hypothetical protein